MNIREEAEALRLQLIMGIVSREQIIAWADEVILREERPPRWLLDLSMAVDESDASIESRLRDLPFEGDLMASALVAIGRFGDAFRSGCIAPQAAAEMMARWAASVHLNEDDWTMAMTPQWVAGEIEYGHTDDEDVAGAIEKALAHFGGKR